MARGAAVDIERRGCVERARVEATGPLLGGFLGELGEIVFTDAVVGEAAGKSAGVCAVFQSTRERFGAASELDVTLADMVCVEADDGRETHRDRAAMGELVSFRPISFIDKIGPQGTFNGLRISMTSILFLVMVHFSISSNISSSLGRRALGVFHSGSSSHSS